MLLAIAKKSSPKHICNPTKTNCRINKQQTIDPTTTIPLTIIIPTFNEEDHIPTLLKQVAWADEVLVVDSFSTDRTVEIAQALGASILQRKYDGPAQQKNWAIPQAKHPWVLILDADERLTPALTKEIKTFLENPSLEYAGYWIGRQNYFMGQKVRYSGWQGDAVIRLIQRDLCRYNNKQVHEEIESAGKIGRLKYKLEHYTYKDLRHFMDKMERYAVWSAADYLPKTPSVTLFHLCLKPLFRFFSHFILKRGFLDGRVGFIISAIMAWGVFMRYVKIKELHRLEGNKLDKG